MIAYIATFRKQRRPTTQLFSLQSIKQDQNMQLQTSKVCNYIAVVLYPGIR